MFTTCSCQISRHTTAKHAEHSQSESQTPINSTHNQKMFFVIIVSINIIIVIVIVIIIIIIVIIVTVIMITINQNMQNKRMQACPPD